ncbi:hypothetical protein OG21DRAFT_1527787 [Imleria badia]|nr:hypothetical protein OG21DRAFT_1527787 [Imleria badia]
MKCEGSAQNAHNRRRGLGNRENIETGGGEIPPVPILIQSNSNQPLWDCGILDHTPGNEEYPDRIDDSIIDPVLLTNERLNGTAMGNLSQLWTPRNTSVMLPPLSTFRMNIISMIIFLDPKIHQACAMFVTNNNALIISFINSPGLRLSSGPLKLHLQLVLMLWVKLPTPRNASAMLPPLSTFWTNIISTIVFTDPQIHRQGLTVIQAPQAVPAGGSQAASQMAPTNASQAMPVDAPAGPLTGPATKLHAYPHNFCEVIERAKHISQCECALVDSFPNRSDFLDKKSGKYFSEAIAEVQRVPDGYWPQYKKDLGIWEALMTWRSMLKAKAHDLVKCYYALGKDHSPDENKIKAEALIQGSMFMWCKGDRKAKEVILGQPVGVGLGDAMGSSPERVLEDPCRSCLGMPETVYYSLGSTNNMAAPALAALITSFFYTGPAALTIIFPEVFSRKVPKVTLHAAIDEYVATGT